MYKGKHVKKKTHVVTRKTAVLLASLVFLLACITGTTIAYLLDNGGEVVNTFTPAEVACVVNEASFKDDVKTNVTVANAGNVPAYIRAAIVVTWQNEDGYVYGVKPVLGTDYTMTLKLKDDQNVVQWIQEDDGYYYYQFEVPVSGSTAVLIDECKPVDGRTPQGYGLNVEIVGSAIQADGMGAASAKAAWNVAGKAS